MGGFGRVVATAVVLAVSFAQASGRAAVILDSLSIRIYDNAGVLAAYRARAVKRAGDILARADLAVDWRDCPAGGVLARAAGAAPPAPGELALRLVHSPKGDPNPRALGNALIDTATGNGTLATVYVDRVTTLSKQGRLDTWSTVGVVMAHEIGHLLLGSNSHSNSGLMREIWTLRDLTRNRPDDWLFSRTQREELKNWRAQFRGMVPPIG